MAELTPEIVLFIDQAVSHDESAAYQESSGDDTLKVIDIQFLIIRNDTAGEVTQRIEVGQRQSIAASGTRGMTVQPIDVVIPAGESMRVPILDIYAQADGTIRITGTGTNVFYLAYRLHLRH